MSVEEQAQVDLKRIVEDCKKRQESTQKLYVEKERALRRKEKTEKRIETDRDRRKQPEGSKEERQKVKQKSNLRSNRKDADTRRHQRKRERRSEEKEQRDEVVSRKHQEPSAAKPRNLLNHFSQASDDNPMEQKEIPSSKKKVRWSEDGSVKKPVVDKYISEESEHREKEMRPGKVQSNSKRHSKHDKPSREHRRASSSVNNVDNPTLKSSEHKNVINETKSSRTRRDDSRKRIVKPNALKSDPVSKSDSSDRVKTTLHVSKSKDMTKKKDDVSCDHRLSRPTQQQLSAEAKVTGHKSAKVDRVGNENSLARKRKRDMSSDQRAKESNRYGQGNSPTRSKSQGVLPLGRTKTSSSHPDKETRTRISKRADLKTSTQKGTAVDSIPERRVRRNAEPSMSEASSKQPRRKKGPRGGHTKPLGMHSFGEDCSFNFQSV